MYGGPSVAARGSSPSVAARGDGPQTIRAIRIILVCATGFGSFIDTSQSAICNCTEQAMVTLDDVLAAQRLITGRLHRTPLAGSAMLSARLDAPLYLKLESWQKTGSF